MIMTNETLISQANGAFGRPFYLIHATAANVPAGSGTRWDDECFKVISLDRNGTRHGRAYKTLDEAQADFEACTTPIVAIEA